MIKDKIIGYCNSLGLDTLGFIPCRRFEELVEFYKYRKENNLENEFTPSIERLKSIIEEKALELQNKIENYSKILGFISEDSESAILRKKEVEEKISIINSMMNYL